MPRKVEHFTEEQARTLIAESLSDQSASVLAGMIAAMFGDCDVGLNDDDGSVTVTWPAETQ